MKPLTLKEVSNALNIINRVNPLITGICTDTRKLTPDCLYIALKGEHFDGHDFAVKAVELGAAAVLCERECGCGDRELLVKDTHAALMQLAAYYRGLFDVHVVAVTGSVGKTTTKEMMADVLSTTFKTLKNEGNLNNEIGLPMTIFNLDDSFRAAVFEMGMSGVGEISRMSGISLPSIGVITNIGVSHIEKLGSKENILKAKLEIMDGMSEHAPLLLNGDDDYLSKAKTGEQPVFYFGIENEDCRFRASEISQVGNKTAFTVSHDGVEQKVLLPTIGRHNVYNALAAYAAGILSGVSSQSAAAALGGYLPCGMRQRINDICGMTFIEDCYNASPDSLRAALGVLADIQAARRIAVIGDMLELGDYAPEAHADIGCYAAEKGVNILLSYGAMAKLTAQKAKDAGVKTVLCFDSKKELADALCTILSPGDAVLFKASRGMGLENVIEIVYRELKADG